MGALEMRRPDGNAANAEAMGACLFWYAKNMLASGADEVTMLTVLQQAREKFSLLNLPEDHFRKVQIRKMVTDLEESLGLAVPAEGDGQELPEDSGQEELLADGDGDEGDEQPRSGQVVSWLRERPRIYPFAFLGLFALI